MTGLAKHQRYSSAHRMWTDSPQVVEVRGLWQDLRQNPWQNPGQKVRRQNELAKLQGREKGLRGVGGSERGRRAGSGLGQLQCRRVLRAPQDPGLRRTT